VDDPQHPPTDHQTLVWACLVPGHVEVRWDGDIASCAHPGCELTSEHTETWATRIRAAERHRSEAAWREVLATLRGAAATVDPPSPVPGQIPAPIRINGR
jgi:hypothetical protein